MIIGIEAERANAAQKTGVEHYAKQLILHLAGIDQKNSYILYLRTKPEEWFFSLPKNFTVRILPFPIFWTQLRISWEILRRPVDVLFIPASAIPIIHPKKTVVTIHDIAWLYFPQSFTRFTRWFLRLSTWFAVQYSSAVIAVSESTKKDLLAHYAVNPEKVKVVWHGYEQANQLVSESAKEQTSGLADGLMNLPQKFVLFLSTLQPRKNLDRLIDAFVALKEEQPDLPHKLVVVGKPGWKFEPILQKIDAHKDIIVYLNHVSDRGRHGIMQQADMLILPSLYEGFGMQILEAFENNLPVAASNVSSIPEVAGDAAVYFDPQNIAEIKKAMQHVILDRSLHDRLVGKGRARLAQFSWKKCAEETLEILTQ